MERKLEESEVFWRNAPANRGGRMRRMCFQLAPASIFIGLAILLLSSGLRAQGDVAKIYKTNCVLCHAADGSGSSPSGKALKAKDLRSPEVQGKSDAELTDVITKGMGKMPAFGKKLSADTIKSLVAYIRELPKKK
jgi:mono/diheme cytochrome c family protein